MQMKTADYAPGHLPYEFELVNSKLPASAETVEAARTKNAWMACRKKVNTWVWGRKVLYMLFLESTLAIVAFAIYFWMNDPRQDPTYSVYAGPLAELVGHIADILNYFSPTLFEGLVAFAVLQKPLWLVGAVVWLLLLLGTRILCKGKNIETAEAARRTVLTTYEEELEPTPTEALDSDTDTQE